MRILLSAQRPEDWQRVEKSIARAQDQKIPLRTYSIGQLRSDTAADMLHWFCVVDQEVIADIFVKTINEDGNRFLTFEMMNGSQMELWIDLAREFFTELAKHNKCVGFRAQALPAQARLFRRAFPNASQYFVLEERV
jgi:hypothetical protein